MSWYNRGLDELDKEDSKQEDRFGPGRFWIPGGTSKDLVYVDDEPLCIHEHNPKINGNYRNWLTCLNGVYDEVVCCTTLGVDSRYYVGYLTTVDCSKWVDGRGNTHQYELRLFPLKMKGLKKFRRKKEDRGGLVNTYWTHTREDSKSPTIGDDWEFRRDVEMAKLFPHVCYRGQKLIDMWAEAEATPEKMARLLKVFQIKPDKDGKLPQVVPAFNYFEILQPKQPKDLRIQLGGVQEDEDDSGSSYNKGGSSSGNSSALNEDDVPF